MTNRSKEIRSLFERLLEHQTPDGVYRVSEVISSSGVYLGRTSTATGSRIGVIFKTTVELPDLQFSKMQWRFLRDLVLRQDDVEFSFGSAVVISVPIEDLEEFVSIAKDLLLQLESGASITEVYTLVKNWAEFLMKGVNFSKEKLLGLWGELFLLALSKRPEQSSLAWHKNPESTWDFTFPDGEVIEVKTTTSTNRVHRFSSNQIGAQIPEQGYIASIVTKETDTGASVRDLIDIIQSRRESSDSVFLLKLGQVLPPWLDESINLRWDANLALESLRFLAMKEIPSPVYAHPVIAVEWWANISSIQESPEVGHRLFRGDLRH